MLSTDFTNGQGNTFYVATVGSGGLVTGVYDCSCGGGGDDGFPPP